MPNNEKARRKANCIRYAKILGKKHFTDAVNALKRTILLHLATKLGKLPCTHCEKDVTLDDHTISHIKPWRRCHSREGNADLFYDVSNIGLAHRACNRPDDYGRVDKVITKLPTDYDCYKNIASPSVRKQFCFDRDLLGIGMAKASHRLLREILFEWAGQCGLNNCFRCGRPINTREVWTIEHTTPWLSGQTDEEKRRLYYDISNIAFSHKHCNCGAPHLGSGISGYNGVNEYFNKRTGYRVWRADIIVKGKVVTLRCCKDIIEAAEAYDMGVLKYRNGEGVLNFPDKIEEYRKKIAAGWHEPLKCKVCGKKHYGHGYCRYHYYHLSVGREKRLRKYAEGRG